MFSGRLQKRPSKLWRFNLNFEEAPDSQYFGLISYYKKLLMEKGGRLRMRRMIMETSFKYWMPVMIPLSSRDVAVNAAIICVHQLEKKVDELLGDAKYVRVSGSGSDRDGMRERVSLEYTMQLNREDENEDLLGIFLKERGMINMSAQEKILEASDAFWGVEALKALNYTEEEIKKKKEYCIARLRKQSQLIGRLFPEIRESDISTVPFMGQEKEERLEERPEVIYSSSLEEEVLGDSDIDMIMDIGENMLSDL
ncbi:MAG: hypothetical protein N5P05_004441 (plasmid) [Chroococcopsis gigantea SAG 12.99]|jgi:hypothetical protein|nr:hypothetical protein [Chlorogloea purpurea SAG 13.99]MDV3002786.1 hypothetical protein [Chroococcopsis gigantea SAG 12.99]